mmetsp:Transcript_24323/g.39971  ORF Transcript_24323/g.39971 Transcript_24323/m.39971 type:complete len:629 (+) Transcript_24323:44-1930(+)
MAAFAISPSAHGLASAPSLHCFETDSLPSRRQISRIVSERRRILGFVPSAWKRRGTLSSNGCSREGFYIVNSNQVMFQSKAREALKRGVIQLADAVRLTLGPKGRNVVIPGAMEGMAPQIINDGVTIARAVDLENPFENTGAKLVRQVCMKTNDEAGDGTTTACILAKDMIIQGLKLSESGANVIDIKKGIDKAVAFVIQELKKISIPCDGEEMIAQVASVSAGNDEEIGRMIAEAVAKVGKLGIIQVESGNSIDTCIEVEEGMEIDRGYLSPQFLTNPGKLLCELDNPVMFLTDMKLTSIQDVIGPMEIASTSGRPLFIIADDVSGDALSALVLNKLSGILSVSAVKAPSFGDRRKLILEDIATLTNSSVISEDLGLDMESITSEMLGSARKVVVRQNKTLIVSGEDPDIKEAVQNRVVALDKQMQTEESDFERDVLHQRISKLSGGIATIRVGAATETEMESKKLRIEDARNATWAAVEEGIVPGGGTALLRLSKTLLMAIKDGTLSLRNQEERSGATIVAKAMVGPAKQIAENAGVDGSTTVNEVLAVADFKFGYNAEKECVEDLVASGIIDPAKVERAALTYAGSVAGMMITTMAAVCEIPDTQVGVFDKGTMAGVDDNQYTTM